MSDHHLPAPSTIPDEGQRRAALLLRTLPALLIPATVALATVLLMRLLLGEPPPPPPGTPGPLPSPIPMLLAQFAVPLLLSALLLVLVRAGRTTAPALVLVGMWTLIYMLGALSSGVMSFWPASLVVPICAAALLIGCRAGMGIAALATLLVVGSAWLETQGLRLSWALGPLFGAPPPPPPAMVPPPPGFPAPPPGPPGPPLLAIGYWVGLFWTVAALTALLAGSVQRALVQSRAQAAALSLLSAELEDRVAAQTAELAQRTARAEALYEVSRALSRTLDLPTVLGLIAEQAARLLRFDASLVLLDVGDAEPSRLVGSYHEPPGIVDALRAQDAVLHQVRAEGPPAIVNLTLGDFATPVAALVLPMRYGTSSAGVLVLVELAGHAERGPDDLALAEGFASQAAVAIANAQLLLQATEAATMEERARLARDIHDTLAQGLTGIVVQLGAAQRALTMAPDQVDEHLALAHRMARESLAEARRSVWNLRAPALERGDLGDALRGLVARPLSAGTATTFEQAGEPWRLAASVEAALLRVCQEALANVAKHARATRVVVQLEYGRDAVRLAIRDNGVGFDKAAFEARAHGAIPWSGFGLLGMRERLAALGGTLAVTGSDGTTVVATVPRPAAAGAGPLAEALPGPAPLDAAGVRR
ncbi:MAG TPA: GAF domain-containing sensor histidine kinase [Chloroflexota bacterium]|nr:GAF domain-containing sensor histidine kinase [Chloroflexota bacterium]